MTINFSIEITDDSFIHVIDGSQNDNDFGILDMVYYSSVNGEPTFVDQELHSSDDREFAFSISADGCYRIMHWLFTTDASGDGEENFSGGYYFYVPETKSIYKYNRYGNILMYYEEDGVIYDAEGTPVQGDLFKGIDITTTNITVDDAFAFSIVNLYRCYIHFAELTLQKCITDCATYTQGLNNDVGKRDFLWAAINVIKYYIGFAQYFKAQQLLEKINKCNGLCGNLILSQGSTNGTDCGCGKSS